ncbi:MAG: SDR family NAD(P)-dependent oxidoreductase [Planctomycetota bacterium]
MDFEDKIVIVTGAASGIGESCARMLLDLNTTVAGFDRKPCKITAQKFKSCLVDVTDGEAVSAAVDEVEKDFNKIDGLVNCAGVTSNAKPFYEMSMEEFETVVSINLTGTFLCSKYVSRKMIEKKKGKIVNISCIRSRIFGPNSADYSASKGGVVATNLGDGDRPGPVQHTGEFCGPGSNIDGNDTGALQCPRDQGYV